MSETSPTAALDSSGMVRRIIIVCAIAQNIVLGFAYGSFGPLLAANEAHFDIGRVSASTGMSLVSVGIGFLGPLAGSMFVRRSVRSWMMFGAILSAIAYLLLALATHFALALVAYAMVGASLAFTAIVGPTTLISRWVRDGRGKALAIVNFPIVLFVLPYLIGALLPHVGRTAILVTMGAASLLLVPLLTLVVDRPPAGASPQEEPSVTAAGSTAESGHVPADLNIWKSRNFWFASLAIGTLAGAGTIAVVHLVPLGTENRMSLSQASLLLSLYTGSGLIGAALLGWSVDRFGALRTLLLVQLSAALLFAFISSVGSFGYYVAAIGLGICLMPLVTVHGATMASLFGRELAGKALGFGYALKLPFTFGMVPLVSYLQQEFDGYRGAFLSCSALLFAASGLVLLVQLDLRRHAARRAGTAGA